MLILHDDQRAFACGRWRSAPAEGCARVWVCCGAGCAGGGGGARAGGGAGGGAGAGWCRAAVPVRAVPARDYKCRAPRHDHTDDPHLLPPDMMDHSLHLT